MTGTGLGQLIAILLSPIVTRIYSPEDFSTLEQFAMILAILGVVACGKYEIAIMQPKADADGRVLLTLSIRNAIVFSLALLVVFAFSSDWIAGLYDNPNLAILLWLMPLAVAGFGIYNALNYWFSRRKQYTRAATSKFLFAVTSEPTKIGLGWLGYLGSGLVVGVVAGRIVTASYMLWLFAKDGVGHILKASKKDLRRLAQEYQDYPKYTILGSLLNRSAQWAHILLFSHFYGPTIIGFFALSRRLFLNPLNIFSQSYSQVFYQRISVIEDAQELRTFYFKNLIRFIGIAAILVVAVHLLPDNTLGFVFGAKWAGVLPVMQVLSWWFALNFVTSALSFVNYRLKKQRTMFWLDLLHFVLVVGAIFVAYESGKSEYDTLVCLVIAKVVYFGLNILASIYFVQTYSSDSSDSQ